MKTSKIILAAIIGFTALAGAMSFDAIAQSNKKTIDPAITKAITAGLAYVPGFSPDAKPDEILATPIEGLYQVVYETRVFYMDASGQLMIQGNVVKLKSGENLSEPKVAEITKKYLANLNLNDAIKHVNGNGGSVIYTFEDPNCGYCKKLHTEMAALRNVTIYTFPVAFLGENSAEKARLLLCTDKKRFELWDLMMQDKPTPNGNSSCEAGAVSLAKNGRHAQKLGVMGTPTLFLKDGTRFGGYVPASQIEDRLNSIK